MHDFCEFRQKYFVCQFWCHLYFKLLHFYPANSSITLHIKRTLCAACFIYGILVRIINPWCMRLGTVAIIVDAGHHCRLPRSAQWRGFDSDSGLFSNPEDMYVQLQCSPQHIDPTSLWFRIPFDVGIVLINKPWCGHSLHPSYALLSCLKFFAWGEYWAATSYAFLWYPLTVWLVIFTQLVCMHMNGYAVLVPQCTLVLHQRLAS